MSSKLTYLCCPLYMLFEFYAKTKRTASLTLISSTLKYTLTKLTSTIIAMYFFLFFMNWTEFEIRTPDCSQSVLFEVLWDAATSQLCTPMKYNS